MSHAGFMGRPALEQLRCGAWGLSLFLASLGLWPPVQGVEAWIKKPGYRMRELTVAPAGSTGFTRMDGVATGFLFTNQLSKARYTTNQTFLNGSGVALGDVDGDGRCDIFICGLETPSTLFRNLGNWKFNDISSASGVELTNFAATSAALADLDGDGDVDLLVSSIGQGTLVFFNDGQGHFTRTGQTPLNVNRAGMSMALADIDGDGDLDLYIANYRMISIRDQPNTRFRVSTSTGKPVVTQVNGRSVSEPDLIGRFELDPNGKVIEHGEPDALYLNDGQGKFAEASFTDGRFLDEDGRPLTRPPYDWGLSVTFRDINRDRAPDLYVCNDFSSPDRLWINDGKGFFRALPRLAMRTTPLFSMGVDFADVNRDGFDDFLVVDMISRDHRKRANQLPDILPPAPVVGEWENRPQYSRNVVQLNRGDGTFAEIGQLTHLYASEWSWSPVFVDVDLDGYEDALIATGNERDSMNADRTRMLNRQIAQQKLTVPQILELKNAFGRLELPLLAFRNRGDLTFEEMGAKWGFDSRGVAQGMALADLDDDGDLDVVVNRLNGPAALYRNNAGAPRIAVRLHGSPGLTRGTGARLTVRGGPVVQSQEMMAAGRYLSSDDAMRTFAAGGMTNRLSVDVEWRGGKTSAISDLAPNWVYEIDESETRPSDPPSKATSPGPFFEDVSGRLNHRHQENAFDDFGRQPLLQRRLSQLGPGVAWVDLDGDGHEDLIVGSGAGGKLAAFKNDGQGGFNRVADAPFNQPVTRDQTSLLGWKGKNGRVTVLAGSANYEDGVAAGPAVRQFHWQAPQVDDAFPGQVSSTGPMAWAEPEGQGRLVLFVGGRVVGGRYPEPASSMLLREVDGHWELDSENSRGLRNLGLVSGAVWSDLDGDGILELLLACEGGPLRVFRTRGGMLHEVTKELGLDRFVGWWNGVATGDLDGDGRMDIVASNWGWNQRYQNWAAGDVRTFYGDFARDGGVAVIEAYWNREMGKAVPFASLDSLARALPFLRERMTAHEAFGGASVEEILGDRAKAAQVMSVQTVTSMLFLNRGTSFEARPLPVEAQFAPAFGVSIGDLDGDGNEDVFLSQNFFALAPEIPRMDAGRSLWLRGDGRGGLQAVSGQESGLMVYGEQRGCALADFDEDGRVDLVVAQNAGDTKLFRNQRARAGLRVRLDGGEKNPLGIGAVLRTKSGGKVGAAREVHAGSGYWSQDSSIEVVARGDAPLELWVRWPGGEESISAVAAGTKEILVRRGDNAPEKSANVPKPKR